MNILWKNGDMFIRDIVAAMPEPRPNYNTVATQVKFLEEKGFVVRRPMANSFLYSVAVSEREYRGRTVGDVVSQQLGIAVRGGGEDGARRAEGPDSRD